MMANTDSRVTIHMAASLDGFDPADLDWRWDTVLGPQIGAQVTDFVIVLNTERAIQAFSKGGNVTLGADASVAAGPVGRAAEADVTPRAAIYTYSKSKGLFIGASLEGAVIGTRKGANERYYGRPVSAYDILSGRVAPPPEAANLRAALSGG